jgi:hypothetical protein
MTKASLTVAACAMLLWTGAASAQQQCDSRRIAAWAKYLSCVDAEVAKEAKGAVPDPFRAFAKCRHKYFNIWPTLVGTPCDPNGGARFFDNGNGTVTDNLTSLVWEKKTNVGDIHDVGNWYTWSTGSNNEDGTAFTTFLTAGLNTPGFAGANGWRMPTLAELQTILKDYKCTGPGGGAHCKCGVAPCIDVTFGPSQIVMSYWTDTTDYPWTTMVWSVDFNLGGVPDQTDKLGGTYVRAVRGGL